MADGAAVIHTIGEIRQDDIIVAYVEAHMMDLSVAEGPAGSWVLRV